MSSETGEQGRAAAMKGGGEPGGVAASAAGVRTTTAADAGFSPSSVPSGSSQDTTVPIVVFFDRGKVCSMTSEATQRCL